MRILIFLVFCGVKVSIESFAWHSVQKMIEDPTDAKLQYLKIKHWLMNRKPKWYKRYKRVDMSNIDADYEQLLKESR